MGATIPNYLYYTNLYLYFTYTYTVPTYTYILPILYLPIPILFSHIPTTPIIYVPIYYNNKICSDTLLCGIFFSCQTNFDGFDLEKTSVSWTSICQSMQFCYWSLLKLTSESHFGIFSSLSVSFLKITNIKAAQKKLLLLWWLIMNAACIAFSFIGASVMMKLFAQNVNIIHITSVLACEYEWSIRFC